MKTGRTQPRQSQPGTGPLVGLLAARSAAANTWFAYGYREGIPRLLDLWDRRGV